MEKEPKEQLKNRILARYANALTRLRLAKENNQEEYEIWGKAYQKLIEYSEIIIPTLNSKTEEELQDIERVYITAEVVHDPTNKTKERRHEEASLLESVLNFHLQILKKTQAPIVTPLSSKKKTDEEKITELKTTIAKSDLLSDLRQLKFSLDSFDNQVIFNLRDFPSERPKIENLIIKKRELEKKLASMKEELSKNFTIEDLPTWQERLIALNKEIKEIYYSLNHRNIININDVRNKYHNAI